ncbi:hypothetical protein [Ilumatobacter sp.]|uniref:hypothetical protein n=1 Tax=Ilumatobacter sp. TaxID=1967498 RepID=UPI003AF5FA7F
MVTTTTPQLGPDRARPSVSSHAPELPMTGSWRDGSVAPGFCGSTGLFATAYTANVNPTTDTVDDRTQIKRPTRHLGTRST